MSRKVGFAAAIKLRFRAASLVDTVSANLFPLRRFPCAVSPELFSREEPRRASGRESIRAREPVPDLIYRSYRAPNHDPRLIRVGGGLVIWKLGCLNLRVLPGEPSDVSIRKEQITPPAMPGCKAGPT